MAIRTTQAICLPLFSLFSCSLGLASSGELAQQPPALRLGGPLTVALGERREANKGVQPACPLSEYSSCGGEFPGYFCCLATETCLSLAANTTALCCPDQADCSQIQPVACDTNALDANSTPDYPIHTLALGTSLPQCGTSSDGTSTCCPFGYLCRDELCVMNIHQGVDTYGFLLQNQNEAPSATAGSTTPVPTPMAQTTETSAPAGNSNKIGIAVGSAAAASLSLAGIVVYFLRKRAKSPDFEMMRPKSTRKASTSSKPLPPLPTPRTQPLERLQPPLARAMPRPSPPAPGRLITDMSKRPGAFPPWPLNTQHLAYTNSFSPVELPATPLSYGMWNNRQSCRASKMATPAFPYLPYRGPSGPEETRLPAF
ncbi:hypothetical protein GQ53DRAFT_748633 [Thozetella sp. PMI_491]|nr:hypothetical protein GQ53DRAFT_748633 [Thozetella sp. PMI_491]